MSVNHGNNSIATISYGNTTIGTAYYGSTLVYTSFKPATYRFDYAGAVQTWTVPKGCKKLIVDCVGAAGGSFFYNGVPAPAGKGGRVTCSLSVSPGQTLYISVGGQGEDYYGNSSGSYWWTYNGGGFNGGGRNSENHGMGGGGTDIRIGGNTLNNRVVVAGGGGYGNRNIFASFVGFGGNGGDLVGQSVTQYGAVVATGGTQTSGGTSSGSSGYNGSFGVGADYGGGGGWYGGAAYAVTGGAGGSSYTHPTLCTNVVHTQGYSEATGNGWIIITTSK